MFILATAGHVDHGKSALTYALTGIDPDRLGAEKERGMTIDIGFAWMKLPSDSEVSIIDVPGHIHFIKNMLTGVGAVDLALLVIAADDGVMPQTKEHLAILNLLRVSRGIAIINKTDLVDAEWLELVRMDVSELLKNTTLAQAPIIEVSSKTGQGIPELISTIDSQLELTPRKKDTGYPRLPIDRIFSISGFGTVITGTLVDGAISVGQEMEILPPHLRVRVRGLQTHKQNVNTALPGYRVAVNLAGASVEEIQRGFILTTPGWLNPTQSVDVQLSVLSGLSSPIAHNASVTFYTGTCSVDAKLRLLDRQKLKPGDTGWVQLTLSAPIVVTKGDLFIIRSPNETLGGGEIIDAHPARHKRFHQSTLEDLEIRMKGSVKDIISVLLKRKEPVQVNTLASGYGLLLEEVQKALQSLISQKEVIAIGEKGMDCLLFSPQGWRRLKKQVVELVESYHSQYPLRLAIPKEELKNKLQLSSNVFTCALQELISEGSLVEETLNIRLPGHQVRLSPEQKKVADSFLEHLTKTPFSSLDKQAPEPELINFLVRQKETIKIGYDIYLALPVYEKMVSMIKDRIQSQSKITLGETRDLFQTSRKYAQALLEYLDEHQITRRIGDERVLR